MSVFMMWMVAALVLAGLELLSGTLYLLAVACGLVTGALASLLWSPPLQIICAALAAVVAVGALHQWRTRRQHGLVPAPMPNLDIGQRVSIDSWTDQIHARVRYRGTLWDAEASRGAVPDANAWYIVAQRGNLLLIDILPPPR
ncbi:NfeD family protein [Silvimonas sp. JCM 19000]